MFAVWEVEREVFSEVVLCLPPLFLLLPGSAWGVIVVDYHLMKSTCKFDHVYLAAAG